VIWRDVLVRRSLDAREIARGLAEAFEIAVDRVMVRPIEDEFPDPAGASVVCLVFERPGGFRTALSIYTYFETTRLDAMSVLRRLSRWLGSEILTSDDDANPYTLIQIAPDGETSKVNLDVFHLDEKDEFHVRPAAFDH